MSDLFPKLPVVSVPVGDGMPVREYVMPAVTPRFGYVKACIALPPGMPDCLEVNIVRTDEGTERTTAVIYGTRAYLIHYALTPD